MTTPRCVIYRTMLQLVPTLALFAPAASAGDWPQWRGPRGDSRSDETGVPVEWSETRAIRWKAAIPQWGASTPAIWGNAIFLTAHDETAGTLLLVRLNKQSGNIEWTRQVGSGEAPRKGSPGVAGRTRQKFHELHNLASPSPVTDGTLVYCHFGNGDLAAYDFSGQQVWKRNLQDDHGTYTIWWGHANSPVLAGDLLISVCMQDSLEDLGMPPAPSYLVAHDKRTGEQRWKTMRMTKAQAEQCDSYITPIIHQNGDAAELLVVGGDHIDAYDPTSGDRRWYLPGIAKSRIITGPTIGHGRIYATKGMRGSLLALNLPRNERGEQPEDRVAWQHDKSTPDSCCPVLWDDLLFIISDNGIAQCLNAVDGSVYWQERLPGDYKASPVAIDGRVYFLSKAGTCTVIAAARDYKKLAENKLEDDMTASPAISDGVLYLRGKSTLYSIGAKK